MCLLNMVGRTSIKLSKSWTGDEGCGLRENYLAQCSICEEEAVFLCEEFNGLVNGAKVRESCRLQKPVNVDALLTPIN